MKLGSVVLRIRYFKTLFKEYVGGCAELDTALNNTLLKESAFVVPIEDRGDENNYDSTANQRVTEKFAVVCALANDLNQQDKLGFLAYDKLDDVRAELINALCGWYPINSESMIVYSGGRLVDINSAYLWWQFEFQFVSRIVQVGKDQSIADGKGSVSFQESNFDDSEIPVPFNTIYMQLIMSPDSRIPYKDEFGEKGDLPYPGTPDMANWIDLTKNPNDGSYANGYASAFNVDRNKED